MLDILGAGFGLIPKTLMTDPRIHITAKAIYALFCSYNSKENLKVYPGRDLILDMLKRLCLGNESFASFSSDGGIDKRSVSVSDHILRH